MGSLSAAPALAGCERSYRRKATAWAARACARPCASTGCGLASPQAYTPRTTDFTHGLRCAPNHLLDQPKPTKPSRVWVSDSTYLPPTGEQWAYLCAFQDAFTRQVVGWRVLDTGWPEELVTRALRQALRARQPVPGLLVHSDRGGQYCANAYRALLDQYECLRSQSLWSRLKTEESGRRERPVFRDLADAPHSVATYFDYYNHKRRHSALAYQSPQSFYLQQFKDTAINPLA